MEGLELEVVEVVVEDDLFVDGDTEVCEVLDDGLYRRGPDVAVFDPCGVFVVERDALDVLHLFHFGEL